MRGLGYLKVVASLGLGLFVGFQGFPIFLFGGVLRGFEVFFWVFGVFWGVLGFLGFLGF